MRNKLTDLNNHLFEQLERLNDDETINKDIEKEIDRTKAICQIASQIISNANLILDSQKFYAEYRLKPPSLLAPSEQQPKLVKADRREQGK